MAMRDIGSHAPRLKAMGRPKVLGNRRSGRAGEPPEGVGKPCRCPASPAASLLPGGSPARSLWVIISAPWYKARPGQAHAIGGRRRGRPQEHDDFPLRAGKDPAAPQISRVSLPQEPSERDLAAARQGPGESVTRAPAHPARRRSLWPRFGRSSSAPMRRPARPPTSAASPPRWQASTTSSSRSRRTGARPGSSQPSRPSRQTPGAGLRGSLDMNGSNSAAYRIPDRLMSFPRKRESMQASGLPGNGSV